MVSIGVPSYGGTPIDIFMVDHGDYYIMSATLLERRLAPLSDGEGVDKLEENVTRRRNYLNGDLSGVPSGQSQCLLGGVAVHPDGESILLDRDCIARRVAELGRQISMDYAGREILAVGVLKGATIFLADLVRAISVPVFIDFVAITSYGAATCSSGEVRILKDLDESIAGRHVVLIEDIVDSGLTLSYLAASLATREPASLRICTLLSKPSRRVIPVQVDYTGFDIPDEFVVGYGLDWAEHHRTLPYIMVLRREVYAGS